MFGSRNRQSTSEDYVIITPFTEETDLTISGHRDHPNELYCDDSEHDCHTNVTYHNNIHVTPVSDGAVRTAWNLFGL